MRSTLAILASSAAAAIAAPVTCTDGLYLIVGRGTNEAPGEGASEVFADAILSKIKGSMVLAVDYPASLGDPSYFESVQEGTKALKQEIADYVKKCPKGKVAYLGYSQGAQMASNAFCGVEGTTFGNTTAIPASTVNDNVVAIVLYGDPSFFQGASYNKGTAKGSGIFARSDPGNCKNYANKLVSYCDDDDLYCDSGKSHEVHDSYLKTYKDQVVKFVVNKYEAAAKAGASGSGNNTSGGDDENPPGKSAGSAARAAHALLVAAPLAAIAALL